MADSKEIYINASDLSKEGYSSLAVKSGDGKLDASKLDTPAAREEVAKLAKAIDEQKIQIT